MKESEVVESTKTILDAELSKKYSDNEYKIDGERKLPNGDIEWRADMVIYKDNNGDGIFEDNPVIAVECKGDEGFIRKGLGQCLSYGWLGYIPVLAVPRIERNIIREFIRDYPLYLIEVDSPYGKGDITSSPDEYRELDIDFRRWRFTGKNPSELTPRQINDSLALLIVDNYRDLGYKSPEELINESVRRRLENVGLLGKH